MNNNVLKKPLNLVFCTQSFMRNYKILSLTFESVYSFIDMFSEDLSVVFNRINEKFNFNFNKDDVNSNEFSRVFIEFGSPKLFSLIKNQSEVLFNLYDNPETYEKLSLKFGGILYFNGGEILLLEKFFDIKDL